MLTCPVNDKTEGMKHKQNSHKPQNQEAKHIQIQLLEFLQRSAIEKIK